MSTLHYDPEFEALARPALSLIASRPKASDVNSMRAVAGGNVANLDRAKPDSPDVEITKHHCTANDGTEIPVFRFAKQGSNKSLGPAVLFLHGGGMVFGSVSDIKKQLAILASQTAAQIFAVDYRLAPESKNLTLVEDCFAGLTWLSKHAEDFHVNPSRIAVMGESAGGGLAAGVALLARDRRLSPPLAKQILIYPMLDDRNTVPIDALGPNAFWSYEENQMCWHAVLGDAMGGKDVSPYAAPARAESVDGLPSTYIDVGGLDIFRDECMKYASRLAAANISTEFHLYPGVPHFFEFLGPTAPVTLRALQNRLSAILTL